jgi:hypothetical protein
LAAASTDEIVTGNGASMIGKMRLVSTAIRRSSESCKAGGRLTFAGSVSGVSSRRSKKYFTSRRTFFILALLSSELAGFA